jgi:hypothetical protein
MTRSELKPATGTGSNEMADESVGEALTGDRHFQQAGLVALLS